MKIGFDVYESPLGPLFVVVDETGVRKLVLSEEEWHEYRKELGEVSRDVEMCRDALGQLDEYFQGERREFDLPFSMKGTPFQLSVWSALQEIPYGETRNYQDIACAVGKPKAPRAIGQANRRNPLPIFIPCHRVIGKKGDLVGYAGTRTDLKSVLLELEGVLPSQA